MIFYPFQYRVFDFCNTKSMYYRSGDVEGRHWNSKLLSNTKIQNTSLLLSLCLVSFIILWALLNFLLILLFCSVFCVYKADRLLVLANSLYILFSYYLGFNSSDNNTRQSHNRTSTLRRTRIRKYEYELIETNT